MSGRLVPGAPLVPGTYVRHPDMPEWGLGQVQSVVGDRVTVNFEHAGKRLINTAAVSLVDADPEEQLPPGTGAMLDRAKGQ